MSTTTNDREILTRALDTFTDAKNQSNRRDLAQQILRELRTVNLPASQRIDYALIFAVKGAAEFKKIEGLNHREIFAAVDNGAKSLKTLTDKPDDKLARARQAAGITTPTVTTPTSKEAPTAVLQPVDATAEPANANDTKPNLLTRAGQAWDKKPTWAEFKERWELKRRLKAPNMFLHFLGWTLLGLLVGVVIGVFVPWLLVLVDSFDKVASGFEYNQALTWPIVIWIAVGTFLVFIALGIRSWNDKIKNHAHDVEVHSTTSIHTSTA